MSLETKINEEIKAAMKNGDKPRLETLRSIRASIIEFAKSGVGREMNEEDEIKILNNQAKKRRDAIDMYAQAGRAELKEQEEFELGVIEEFLPEKMDESKVKEVILGIIAEVGAEGPKDMGKVMGPSMKALAGKADGSLVQKIVKESLGMA